MNDASPVRAATALSARPKVNWTAQMVRPLADGGVETPATFLRKSFTVDGAGDAVLRISAQGLYRAFINGQRVGNDLLTPGWTAYDQRLSYQTYDVGPLLQAGDNVIEIWLADGWFRSQMMWGEAPIYNTWGDTIAAIAELRGGDGKLLLATDASWQSGELPIRKSGIYFGEIYDAGFTPAVTAGSEVVPFDQARLVAYEAPPVRELAALEPVANHTDDAGRRVYDFGQNSGGYVAFTVRGQAGARIIVEHAEILDKDGQFYNGNLRTAAARLEYALSGNGDEHYRPTFTFQGFRYARVTIEGQAELIDIVSVPISSVHELKAGFTSGNALVNRLFLNTVWSQRANFIEVPTDCPQRDERLGWTGDAQVFAGTACYLGEVQGFFRKWIRDVMADQREDGAVPHVVPDPTRLNPKDYPGFYGSTGWGDAIAMVPWQVYLHYGDTDFLAETLPAMVKWVDFVWSISNGPIVKPPRAWGGRGFTFGDWLQPSGPSAKPLPTISDDAAATMYLFITSTLVGRIAGIVGNEATAIRMADIAGKVKAAFAGEFITPNGRVAGDDQTSYALAFLHGLIPQDSQGAAKAYFKNSIHRTDGRIGTGFIGTPALLPALVQIGEMGLASEVFLQENVPGWLYQVRKGATTIWERWDAIQEDGSIYNPQMNSYNHYAYGAVCQWLLEGVAGFRPDPTAPGFAHIIFEPTILDGLSPVAAHHDSPNGRIEAGWTVDGDRIRYRFVVPLGATATLRLRPEYRDAVLDGVSIASGADISAGPGEHIVDFIYSVPPREVHGGPMGHSRTP
ncbi:MAG: Bacterial alpha-L-rhamnosidase [Devosia sp.]|uniref:alpha-L-rhamnosidase n=1 Tax=Devosia sp. TaxID=1871048 RepID=UPI002605247D|nr:alpha-L-rhamnosidase [Devosia sp.]MDB5529825.1 Bacterial alpha-L-rhamnosidase [Devosia sp.]